MDNDDELNIMFLAKNLGQSIKIIAGNNIIWLIFHTIRKI